MSTEKARAWLLQYIHARRSRREFLAEKLAPVINQARREGEIAGLRRAADTCRRGADVSPDPKIAAGCERSAKAITALADELETP